MHGCAVELYCLQSPYRWARYFVFRQPRSNHDLRSMGSLCLARVASATPKVKVLLTWMFILFLCGLGTVAIAPLFNLR
jgi:hypothetical protein